MKRLLPGRTEQQQVFCGNLPAITGRGRKLLRSSTAVAIFYQTAFNTALVLSDRNLVQTTGFSSCFEGFVVLFKDGITSPVQPHKLVHVSLLQWGLCTTYRQYDRLEKIKTFTVGSYSTDQQLRRFLHKENKSYPVCLALHWIGSLGIKMQNWWRLASTGCCPPEVRGNSMFLIWHFLVAM